MKCYKLVQYTNCDDCDAYKAKRIDSIKEEDYFYCANLRLCSEYPNKMFKRISFTRYKLKA